MVDIVDTTRRKPDYPLLTAVGVLVPIGLVMVYSSSFVDAYTTRDGPLYYALRQLVAGIIGTIALLVAMRIDYRFWQKYSLHFMGATVALLAVTLLLPADLTVVNGAKSWIRIGTFSMQPSEIAKLALIIYFANWLSKRRDKLSSFYLGLIPVGVALGVVCGLVLLGGDLGTTIVIALIGLTVYFVAGANLLHILFVAGLAVGVFLAMINAAAYRMSRIEAWRDPFANALGAGYHAVHSLLALGSGGLFGVGLGQARQKFLWLPQAHTDTIFSIIGEEFGFIGTMFIVICFLVIAYRGMRIAGRSSDPFAALLAVGITAWLVFQALINIAVVTTVIPFTGLTLPFISYGGTSLVMSMVAAGILLNISKHTSERLESEPTHANPTPRRPEALRTNPLVVWWRNRGARLPSAGSRRRAYRRS
jgi:cell division protein FtsW